MNVFLVELPEFIRKSKKLFNVEEHDLLLSFLAIHPTAGVLNQGAGGVRKLRWATGNKGKSGGTRIICFYHNTAIPLFLLTAFSKSERENLTKAEQNELAGLMKILVATYKGKNE